MTQNEVEGSKAPLMEHLLELRKRLIWCVVAICATFVVCFIFAENIYYILLWPYQIAVEDGAGINMQFTAPQEFFFTKLRLSLFGAVFLSFPIIAAQLYKFVAPGLYKNERASFLPYLIATPILFVLGASVVYFIVMPLAMQFFLSMQLTDNPEVKIELVAKVSEYFSLIMTLILAFGFCFQLPVVLTLMARAGILTAETLQQKRKYAVVGVFAMAALLTPPDPISQIGLALPTLALYEVSIYMVQLVEKKRAERKAAQKT